MSDGGRRVAHKYGFTEVVGRPERVVTIGLVDHDAVLAVGVVPVGLTSSDYSSQHPSGVWPWAQDRLGDATPVVLNAAALNYEAIARLDPDLIIAAYAGLTDAEYQTLSEIAPTVAQSGDHDDYQTPWHVMTRTIGDALGRREEADAAVEHVEQLFGAARTEHPHWAEQTAVYAGVYEPGQYYAEVGSSTRAEILTELGFQPADDLESDGAFYVDVSSEQLEVLDRDVLVWELGSAELVTVVEDDPVYQQLAVRRERRDVLVADPEVAAALVLVSVLSLPLVIDHLVPRLAAAADRDPATTVPA